MKTKTIALCALCLLMVSLANFQNAIANDTDDALGMAIDPGQSNVSLTVAGTSDTSTISGPVELILGSLSTPFGTAQVTEVQVVLDEGFDISFLGGLVSVSAEPDDVVITMQAPGPAGVVDGNNQFSQLGNIATATGQVEVFDPLNLAGGSMNIDLAASGPLQFDIQNAQLGSGGGSISLSLDLFLAIEVAAGIEASIDGTLVASGALPDMNIVQPTAVNVFRGSLLNGGLAEVTDSDDMYMQLNPGFTLSAMEAPVTLLFDTVLEDDSPAGLSYAIESNVDTPGIEFIIELFNFDTSAFEVLSQEAASFNMDSIFELCPTGDLSRFVEPATAAVEARVGWVRTGFTIVFPWQVNVDQVSWTVTK